MIRIIRCKVNDAPCRAIRACGLTLRVPRWLYQVIG